MPNPTVMWPPAAPCTPTPRGPRPWTPGLPEPGPVEQLLLPDGSPIWMITRYEDALAALNNRKLSKNFDNALPELWPRWATTAASPSSTST